VVIQLFGLLAAAGGLALLWSAWVLVGVGVVLLVGPEVAAARRG
jgi:hypothetical protein